MNYKKARKKMLKTIHKMMKACKKCEHCKCECILIDLVKIETKLWEAVKDENNN